MKLCMIGTGYVGLVSGVCFADLGNEVICVDKDNNKINNLKKGIIPIYEPGLEELVLKNYRNKRLSFSSDLKTSVRNSDIVFICVGTPTKKNGIGAGKASDLKWIEASARHVARCAKGTTIVVEKSTLPVKTALTIKRILESQQNNNPKSFPQSFAVLSNPEFMSEGNAIKDLENPNRVLIGGEDKIAIEVLAEIYSNWVPNKKIIRIIFVKDKIINYLIK